MDPQEDTGDVISVNGTATEVETEVLDRGDVVDPGEAAIPETAKTEPAEVIAPEVVEPAHEQRPQMIPKARFNEVIDERNSLKEQLAEAQQVIAQARSTPAAAQAAVATTPAFDEAAMERKYIETMIDGDTDKAASLRMEINANLREQATQEAQHRINASNTHAQAVNALNSAAQQAVADFPYLDTEEGADALELILAARDRRIAAGTPEVQALREAVSLIAPKFAPPGSSPPVGIDASLPQIDTRTQAAIARGAADSNLQPPTAQAGTGQRAAGARVNVAELSEEQFENLSTAEKRRLRGDL